MTSATAHDYAWICSSRVFGHALDTGYTLTLVRDVAPQEVLRVMEAEPQGVCTGADALIERRDELIDPMDHWDASFVAGAFSVLGEAGDWTLVLHFADGGMGMRPHFLQALSAGGRAVAHSSNGGKPLDFFHWYEDGELRTTFEGWPAFRDGSTPDTLDLALREAGFDLSDDEDGGSGPVDRKAAVFALAERLTGVRVTEELLRDAEYHLGYVPDEHPAPRPSPPAPRPSSALLKRLPGLKEASAAVEDGPAVCLVRRNAVRGTAEAPQTGARDADPADHVWDDGSLDRRVT